MFVSVLEPTLQTSSNSLFAFAFCNLIILMIVLGSRFGSSDSGTRDALPGRSGYSNAKRAEIVDVERRPDQMERASRPAKQVEEKLALVQVMEACDGEINGKEEREDDSCEYKYEDESGEYDYEAGNEDNGEEDNNGNNDEELKRRFEDFITKVNREWREENSKDPWPLTWITQEA